MPTTSKTISKGIREITYTKKDGSKVIKFQVRSSTKENPNFTMLVESLEVAKELVANNQSSAGRELLKSLKIKANQPKKFKSREERSKAVLSILDRIDDEQVLHEVLHDESLKTMLTSWYEMHIKKQGNNPVDLKNNKTYESLVNVICSTKIVDWHKQNRVIESLPLNLRSMVSDPKRIEIGKISIFELTSRSWLDYVNTRLAEGKAKGTIVREIGAISSMYGKLYFLGDRYKDIPNPIDKRLKEKLKNFKTVREVRISLEEENKLEKALSNMRNKDMLAIFSLAMATGCRRSEVLFWEWSNVHLDKNYYFQKRTKTGVPRKIKLLPEAKKILESLKKVEGRDRIFNYSIEGFKTNWQRARETAGLKHIQFRDLRNEFISRMLEQTNNPIVVSSLVDIKNQTYFSRSHGKVHEEKQFLGGNSINPEYVQKQVGHSTANMTSHYNRTNFENDGSLDYKVKQTKLKVKFNKATPEEKDFLLKYIVDSNYIPKNEDALFKLEEFKLKMEYKKETDSDKQELLELICSE